MGTVKNQRWGSLQQAIRTKQPLVAGTSIDIAEIQLIKESAGCDSKQLHKESLKTLRQRTGFKAQNEAGRVLTWEGWLK